MYIVGMMIVGEGEAKRYLKRSLDELKRLCDTAIICLNGKCKDEAKMVKEYGFWAYRDERVWGREQPNIKTDLLEKVGRLKPHWIIALDADEVFAPEFTREEAERLSKTGEVAFHFLVVNLYNDPDHFVHGVGIQRFWNVRFFKFLPEMGIQYQRKRLHCGLAPPFFYHYGWYAPYYLEHYGLMTEESRLKKAERYKEFDPECKFKHREYYDDLVRELKPVPFDREGLLKKLKESKECQKRQIPKAIQ